MVEKLIKNRKKVDIVVIILIGCILGLPLLRNDINVYFDDGIHHISRAYGTFLAMKENFLFPKVIFSFVNTFGYSWDLFYGPLSTIGVIVFGLICGNFVNGYKICTASFMIFSGFTMYKFIYGLTKKNNTSLLASVLYMTFPYHLTDMYSRNALGEFTAFIFVPLVFLGLYNLLCSKGNSYYLAIGAIGLILTHNITTIIVALIAFCYFVLFLKKIKEKKVRNGIIINLIFIITITSFFWVPLIEAKFNSDYMVYVQGMMTSPSKTASMGLSIKNLLFTQNEATYVFELGPHIILMMLLSIFAYKGIKKELKMQYIIFLIFGLISLWMTTKYFPWKFLSYDMCIIQFPWRMLMMVGFFFCTICAMNMEVLIKNFNYKDVILISVIAILYLLALSNNIVKIGKIQNVESFELGALVGDEDNWHWSAGIATQEYLPTNAYYKREYIATRENRIYVLDEENADSKVEIIEENKDGSKYTAIVNNLKESYSILELPYIYYPGYVAKIDGRKVNVFETENGFTGIYLTDQGRSLIEFEYEGTKAMWQSLFISVISFIIFTIYVCRKHQILEK